MIYNPCDQNRRWFWFRFRGYLPRWWCSDSMTHDLTQTHVEAPFNTVIHKFLIKLWKKVLKWLPCVLKRTVVLPSHSELRTRFSFPAFHDFLYGPFIQTCCCYHFVCLSAEVV